ncbi:hypothetical protein PYCCODRAFT_1441226 [Trametes coccinea BRFM310]|uniref:NAD(P)-binding domain-containing protein n=1 Tax=Trametes coccinea (strain BRFM310) TaxID=1353009 RepID=A0A1Y2J7M5_TRAC3|nr:hypothetical protein PYCCODRAFT_1441226 [Trametes coccinea BRFM310]
MHAFVLGGSKNIGYYAALRLLEQGATVTFLLRRTNVFENDEQMQRYVKSGQATLVCGDGLKLEDVQKGWEAALEAGNGSIDVVLFTIGGVPTFQLTKGFVLNPPDLCTRSLLNLFRTIPSLLRDPASQPRFIIVTSRGITPSSHKTLPFALKGFYGTFLAGPHADKLGAERVLAHVMGRPWDAKTADGKVRETVLPTDWHALPGLPARGELKRVVIVRPALLTDGECHGDEAEKTGKAPYKAIAGEIDGGYTVSRRDTAHFIVNGALKDWEKWQGKGVVLVY